MRRNAYLYFASMTLLTLLPFMAFAAAAQELIVTRDAHGAPNFVRGELGFVDSAVGFQPGAANRDGDLFRLSVQAFLDDFAVTTLGAAGTENFEAYRSTTDNLGLVHTRFDQSINGLKVVGAQLIVHSDAKSGAVYAVNGNLARDIDLPAPSSASVTGLADKVTGEIVGSPELSYFHDADTGKTHLTWQVRAQGVSDGMFFDDIHYFDALNGKTVAVDAQVHTARSRETYTANNSADQIDLPGTLLCDEQSISCGDASGQRAHDGAGDVYDYYSSRFNRDGINDHGLTTISTVHFGSNFNNAAWTGNQVVYGDGNGIAFDDFTKSFDIIAHEVTHGVTAFESDLIYQKESGALNEALSDIFAAAMDSYRRGVVDAATWKIGEDSFTPGIPGDALRYMNDPTLDGNSRDHYDDRLYPGACVPSSSNDRCGVHHNSGIANLAFYLLVAGGSHPSGTTTLQVPAIGMSKAEQIFYRAQTTYLTPSSNFAAARTATLNAARDLYGNAELASVETAWCAVGVGCEPLNAAILSYELPTALSCGEATAGVVTVLNTGTEAWSKASGHRLGALDNTDPLYALSRVDLPAGVVIEPGDSHSFRFFLRAPQVAGTYLTDWQMLKEHVRWFGGVVASTVEVTCPDPDPIDNAVVDAHELPATMSCGESQTVSISMRNNGNTTWTAAAGYQLGGVGDADPFVTVLRRTLPAAVSIGPTQKYAFEVELTAPNQPGTYRTDWRMLKAGVHWFGQTAFSDVVVSCPPQLETLTITPIADGTVFQDQPALTLPWDAVLKVRADTNGMGRRTYFRFNVPTIQGTIVSAKLKLKTRTHVPEIAIYRVNNMTWTEQTLNWNNQFAGGATYSYLRSGLNWAAEGWYELDVTNGVSCCGLIDLGTTSGYDVDSSFYGRASVHGPQLVITYEPN